MKTGIELIAQERQEQIEKHGYTTEWDTRYTGWQLLDAASRLLNIQEDTGRGESENHADGLDHFFKRLVPEGWDKGIWERMCNKPYKDRLIIAGALIAAEIDRLQSPSPFNQPKQ